MKLEPIRKLTGSSIVSFISKLTLLLFELFCIPINNKKNKQRLNVNVKSVFLNVNFILLAVS